MEFNKGESVFCKMPTTHDIVVQSYVFAVGNLYINLEEWTDFDI